MAERRPSVSWSALEADAAELGAAGRRLLVGDDGVAIAFLATASAEAQPHLAPVCPIFCDGHLHLCAAGKTVKVDDLRASGAFVLHAFLGPHDEEFQLAGVAHEVTDAAERARVHAAIPFAGFDREDPIFRLGLERALWVHWERVGQPDTKPVRRRWTATPTSG